MHGRWDGWRGAKLFIDTIRWQIPRLAPGRYGVKPGDEPIDFKVEIVNF